MSEQVGVIIIAVAVALALTIITVSAIKAQQKESESAREERQRLMLQIMSRNAAEFSLAQSKIDSSGAGPTEPRVVHEQVGL